MVSLPLIWIFRSFFGFRWIRYNITPLLIIHKIAIDNGCCNAVSSNIWKKGKQRQDDNAVSSELKKSEDSPFHDSEVIENWSDSAGNEYNRLFGGVDCVAGTFLLPWFPFNERMPIHVRICPLMFLSSLYSTSVNTGQPWSLRIERGGPLIRKRKNELTQEGTGRKDNDGSLRRWGDLCKKTKRKGGTCTERQTAGRKLHRPSETTPDNFSVLRSRWRIWSEPRIEGMHDYGGEIRGCCVHDSSRYAAMKLTLRDLKKIFVFHLFTRSQISICFRWILLRY